ncbi:hypothetical protein D3C72_672830 [compost metagenome]
MSRMTELVQKRAEHEALVSALRAHAFNVVSCGCWHHESYGVERLQSRLSHMKRLAERLEATLEDIQAIEDAVMTR